MKSPRRSVRRWLRLPIAALCAVALVGTGVTSANAAVATNFNAGNIISDDLFYDGGALSEGGIQDFLNQKVPRCTIGDPGKPPGGIYTSPSGWSVTLATACLKDGRYNTVSMAANPYCSSYASEGAESAARIIAKLGKACGISPKVLLVMLEKEQSLVQDTFPAQHQLDRAMGYACPDSGPNNSANCDTKYYGFFNQVYYAAWQLKVYKAFPNSYSYKPFQVNTIQWHPNIGCGTSQVYIENWATAALYIYTPYRPNQAALNAQWGLGDSCSSYGNRNFYLYYHSWFANARPFGDMNSARIDSPGLLTVRGWAIDPDTTSAISVRIRIGATSQTVTANIARPDVGAVFPNYGNNHGFELVVNVSALSGDQSVCLDAIDTGDGSITQIECQTVNVSIPTASRISGSDRYETAVAISQYAYPSSRGGIVVLTTGENYPDSLSAAPLAAKLRAPVLLTYPGALPASTSSELSRLAPATILVIGGPAAITEAVEQQVSAAVPGATVRRIFGADRYATSLAVISDPLGWSSSPTLFVATGESFADALSAGAAAGSVGAPVLLVRGGDLEATAEQQQLLNTLGVSNVRVAGGVAAVSEPLGASIAAGRSLLRYAGVDRFDTSAKIGADFNTARGTTYRANGTSFADALAGAAVAGAQKMPLLLSSSTCVPGSVRNLETLIRPSSVKVLGGTSVLSEAVRLNAAC